MDYIKKLLNFDSMFWGSLHIDMVKLSKIPIRRHIKIKAEANLYDDQYEEYFKLRKENPKRGKVFVLNTAPYHQFDASLGH